MAIESTLARVVLEPESQAHDFMMLTPLSDTRGTRAAVAQAIATLRQALHTA